ncbi:MAG: carbohydrate ABC transporter permease [Saccharofermentanales bacterium]
MKLIKKKHNNRSIWVTGSILVFLMAIAGFTALPFVYTISTAFKPLDEIFIFPPRFFVRNPTFDNFNDLVILFNSSWVPFTRYFFNTVYITVMGTVGHVVIASLGAYILAKHDFWGKNFVFGMIVLSLMFAGQVTYIPNYIILSRLHLINTYYAVIIPAFSSTLGIFLMKQFMEGIPDTLIEAAKIDGAKELYIFWKIAMPLVKPAWLTLIIFSFQALWNNNASLYIFKETLKTLPYALQQVLAGGVARTGSGAAVALVLMVVPISLFMFTQSNIMETMAKSGIKE